MTIINSFVSLSFFLLFDFLMLTRNIIKKKTYGKFPDHANRNYYERDTEFEVLLNWEALFPGLDLNSGLDWTLDWTPIMAQFCTIEHSD